MAESRLWYKKPANFHRWTEALPIGNGRLGAMIFGGTSHERIQLNEDSCWSGGYRNRNNPDAAKNLQLIRSFLREGKVSEAEELSRYALTAAPEFQRTYQTLGDLHIQFKGMPQEIQDYERSLSLDDAMAVTTFTAGGYQYQREIFASFLYDVIAIKLTTNNPAGMSFDARLVRNRFCEETGAIGNNIIYMDGVNGGADGISFCSMVSGYATTNEATTIGEYLVFDNVSEVVLYVTAATSFRSQNTHNDCLQHLDIAREKGYCCIRGEHIKRYQFIEKRVSFNLTGSDSDLPTDERLALVKEGQTDLGLIALYFRYGRYLLISCSYPGALPANLQGLWCQDFLPAWDSKYTININAQMNYWPAEVCNLPECHEPLFDLIKHMHANGTITAKEMYGASGFVAHHNTDIWGDTAPQDTWIGSTYWVMGAAWLCLHIWEHYEYTLDKDLLAEHFYLIKDACLFFVDFLITNNSGELVVSPTVSPENTYILSNGQHAWLTEGCTMDSQILDELFNAYEQACRVLDCDFELAETIAEMRAKLPATKVGKNGGIMEWLEEKEEAEPGHRHISHLFALFPGNAISPEATPELAAAARRTLDLRLSQGGGHTGWSRAWIINFYARLGDGKETYHHLNELLRHSTLPNLFDDHPPFQIDGNFGATAAIAHMFVQSTKDKVHLLKALPNEWRSGSVKGLCAKGGLIIDICWEDGILKDAYVTAKADYTGTIIYQGNEKAINLAKGTGINIQFYSNSQGA